MIFEFGSWIVPVKNKKAHADVIEVIYTNIRRRRNEFTGILSSKFYTTKNRELQTERWIYVDIYENMRDLRISTTIAI